MVKAEPNYAIGVDLGATKIDLACINNEGLVADRIKIPTHALRGSEKIISDIISGIKTLQKRTAGKCILIALAVAGQIVKESGAVTFAPNLQWHNVPLKEILQKHFQAAIYVCNDVRAATYGEWLFGAGDKVSDFVCVFVGSGIGAGIISGGRLVEGGSNCAGELGHMTVDLSGRMCRCGNRGCLEALASGWAIEDIAREAVVANPIKGAALLAEAGGSPENIHCQLVCRSAEKGDLLSQKIVENAIQAIIGGMVTIVNGFNPQKIVFWGGVVAGNPDWIEQIACNVKNRALGAATGCLEIVPAALQKDSVVVGAVAWAKDLFLRLES